MPISITSSTTAPTEPPLFDPRTSPGISLHYQTFPDRRLYVGLQRTGSPQWFYINSSGTHTTSGTGSPRLAQIYVSASTERPDFRPYYPLSQAQAVQYHVVYGASGYELCVGLNSQVEEGEETAVAWAIYYADGTHTP